MWLTPRNVPMARNAADAAQCGSGFAAQCITYQYQTNI
jgi:hypothetical protein